MSELLRVEGLKKYFKTPKGQLHAVDGVSFSIEKGKTLGVVGESGCGKSTLGRCIIHLLDTTDGKIFFEGKDITNIKKEDLKESRKDMQMIFQDPFSSINPRMTVKSIIIEPMVIHNMYNGDKAMQEEKVLEIMDTVGLARRLADSYPHELDGGRRQRIGIARALALEPKFIVCDEPVSALDVSIQAQILNLMQDLQEERGLTYIFITHDMSVVKHISDDICVMYLGTLVEKCPADKLFEKQYHPYTQALLSAIPIAKAGARRERILLKGEITSPINPEPGCRFAPRCLYAKPECFKEQPKLKELEPEHFAACHLY
ncbi:MAG: ATP-binding cassette domain-containing protein [Lachnospiraceae bacterium]|uniref:ABC transporter ATP-binding protein n=1 Tax=Candidatus Merdisoma sp. JLR.KK011 TaxID=3114299 RepID=UPI0029DDD73E|nr:ATP-binding cassette domain-containing protein [Lachnospiraceae bacterium]MCI9382748.1 ATP-binding cassette domain-containing protein [Lachnospiraceae bacterium]MCI9623565.1 ATP-binding cassette domain-containing protein [Lachnospiraceae bacterium]